MAGRFSVEAVFKAVDRITAPVTRMQNRLGKFTRAMKRGFRSVQRVVGKLAKSFKRLTIPATIRAVPATTAIPKRLKLETYQVTERYGMIWVCLKSEAIAPLPEWPELEQDAANWTTIELPVGTWNSTAARHVENFNDDAHLSWIHTDTFGNPSTPQIPEYQVEHLDNGIVHEIPYLEVFKKRDGTLIEAPMHYQLQINFPFISTLTTKRKISLRFSWPAL